jgi:hypothetical protein
VLHNSQNSLNDLDFDEEVSKFKSAKNLGFDLELPRSASRNIRCSDLAAWAVVASVVAA